jgi:hypothetical protein
MVREIEEGMEGVKVVGERAVCRQHPHDRPSTDPPRTPAPRFHAVEPQVRRALEWAYRLTRNAYAQAFEALCLRQEADFPPGSFVPGRFLPLRV